MAATSVNAYEIYAAAVLPSIVFTFLTVQHFLFLISAGQLPCGTDTGSVHKYSLQDIKKLAKYFPSLYKTVETNVMDGLNRIYKMNLYNFNPELNRRNFSADELINANPNFNGRISDDGTFVLLGVGESIDDLQKFDADEFVNALFYSDSKTEETEE